MQDLLTVRNLGSPVILRILLIVGLVRPGEAGQAAAQAMRDAREPACRGGGSLW